MKGAIIKFRQLGSAIVVSLLLIFRFVKTEAKKYRKLTLFGLLTIFLGLATTVSRFSVTTAGRTESFIYFGVSCSLALVGVVMVGLDARREPEPHQLDHSAGESADPR